MAELKMKMSIDKFRNADMAAEEFSINVADYFKKEK
jgi:hypothetical protein